MVRAGGDGRGPGMPSFGGQEDSSKGKDWGDVLDKFASKYGEDTFIRNSNYPSSKNTIKLKDLFKGQGAQKSYQVNKAYYGKDSSEEENYKGDFNWDNHHQYQDDHYAGDVNPYGHDHSAPVFIADTPAHGPFPHKKYWF